MCLFSVLSDFYKLVYMISREKYKNSLQEKIEGEKMKYTLYHVFGVK